MIPRLFFIESRARLLSSLSLLLLLTSALPSQDPGLPGIGLERVFPRLRFHRPVFLCGAGDGSGRLFVVEQAGVIRVFDPKRDATRSRVFLDLRDRVSRRGNEEGLLGLAFHPEFAKNGRFFVHYSSRDPDKVGRLVSFRADPKDGLVLMDSETLILEQRQPYRNHNGGMIAFGPDGFLYLSFGDGGAFNDPLGSGQDRSTWLGAILRIDVDQKTDGRNFGVPADNPFVQENGGVRPEIWAFGFRNVWRFSFDRKSGELWAGDVGQNRLEEVDRVVRGGNFGWRRFEAGSLFLKDTPLGHGVHVPPVASYGRSLGISITGGYVYRGPRHPALQGQYVFADYASGNLFSLDTSAKMPQKPRLRSRTGRSIASFGEDDQGELYACCFDGGIYAVVPKAEAADPLKSWPRRLSETGFTERRGRRLRLSSQLLSYEVNAPFWSDGAEKTRFLSLPKGTKLGFRGEGSWEVPVGAAVVKHFRSSGRRGRPLETRVIRKTKAGWEAATYLWSRSQRDAVLAPEGRQFEIRGPRGVQDWHAPSSSECASCHQASTGFVIGLSTAQLNHELRSGGNQIEGWRDAGLVDLPEDWDATRAPRHVDPHDRAAKLDARARTWLDVNCAFCHRPEGTANATIDLRRTATLGGLGVIGTAPVLGGFGLEDARLVAPGAPERSVLLHRVKSLSEGRMPPLGSNRVDERGARLIEEWIRSLR